ncbi:hypothetical protein BDR22DRAFT_890909 [Usnea florida]
MPAVLYTSSRARKLQASHSPENPTQQSTARKPDLEEQDLESQHPRLPPPPIPFLPFFHLLILFLIFKGMSLDRIAPAPDAYDGERKILRNNIKRWVFNNNY